MTRKREAIWAYIDGVKYVDVVQVARISSMSVDGVKNVITQQHPGYEVTFKSTLEW